MNKISRTRLAEAIAAHTYYDGVQKQYAKQVAAYLIDTGRVKELDSLLRDVSADWAAHGYVEVLARSAHPLTEAAKKDITRQVKSMYPAADKVTVTEVHDESVVGGVRLELANEQLDLSIRSKLNRFKQLTTAGGSS